MIWNKVNAMHNSACSYMENLILTATSGSYSSKISDLVMMQVYCFEGV